MNANIKIFLLCPIPEDQKPINEFLELKDNFLFNWIFFSKKQYIKKFISFYTTIFIFSFFILLNPFQKYNFHLLFLTSFIATILFFLLIIGIYLRISEINNRFNNPRLFYEEASWYDGQIWEKPYGLIRNDKLISRQKIQPIQKRLKLTLGIIFLLILLFGFLFEFF